MTRVCTDGVYQNDVELAQVNDLPMAEIWLERQKSTIIRISKTTLFLVRELMLEYRSRNSRMD